MQLQQYNIRYFMSIEGTVKFFDKIIFAPGEQSAVDKFYSNPAYQHANILKVVHVPAPTTV